MIRRFLGRIASEVVWQLLIAVQGWDITIERESDWRWRIRIGY